MRRRLIHPFLRGALSLVLLSALFPACAAETAAGLLVYHVDAPDGESYISRLLATPDFLRLDQGEQDPGFILFDRRQRIIYSVNPSDRSILVIDPPDTKPQTPDDTVIEVTSVVRGKVPEVAGTQPQHWVLLANGTICREAFVAPALMSGTLAAYGEYLQVLAAQQALALPAIPDELKDACDSAVHVYAADALLQKGLPLKVWNNQGYREELMDFRPDFRVSDESFTLPEGFQRVPMMSGI